MHIIVEACIVKVLAMFYAFQQVEDVLKCLVDVFNEVCGA